MPNGTLTSDLAVEYREDAADRPAADRACGAGEPRCVHHTQAAVAARVDRHRRPPLQAHHAHRIGTASRTCVLHKHRLHQGVRTHQVQCACIARIMWQLIPQ
jgi:hypothetical protein